MAHIPTFNNNDKVNVVTYCSLFALNVDQVVSRVERDESQKKAQKDFDQRQRDGIRREAKKLKLSERKVQGVFCNIINIYIDNVKQTLCTVLQTYTYCTMYTTYCTSNIA